MQNASPLRAVKVWINATWEFENGSGYSAPSNLIIFEPDELFENGKAFTMRATFDMPSFPSIGITKEGRD